MLCISFCKGTAALSGVPAVSCLSIDVLSDARNLKTKLGLFEHVYANLQKPNAGTMLNVCTSFCEDEVLLSTTSELNAFTGRNRSL